ncbi:hypothetical protein OHB26_38675 (plasmid) [Nocardia sp. NBC_01503]|uniref:hypothetical protein n=1 Tax=Nocardia sp. NBC_01503 TaxID=2975997 RepID=UPI002E7BE92F|nr:hypothetical protein [Nocardia sp. NBC_01503]WTL36603.1 hypothetical protein OHB26_38675 [Nocardia sp. NBC_01503]
MTEISTELALIPGPATKRVAVRQVPEEAAPPVDADDPEGGETAAVSVGARPVRKKKGVRRLPGDLSDFVGIDRLAGLAGITDAAFEPVMQAVTSSPVLEMMRASTDQLYKVPTVDVAARWKALAGSTADFVVPSSVSAAFDMTAVTAKLDISPMVAKFDVLESAGVAKMAAAEQLRAPDWAVQMFCAPMVDVAKIATASAVAAKYAGTLDDLLPRIDVGAMWQVADVARSLMPIAEFTELWRADLSRMSAMSTMVSDLLGNWEFLRRAGHRRAGRGVRAALVARMAVLNELGSKSADSAVAAFASRWLGFKPVRAVIDAVSTALLEDQWLAGEDPDAVLAQLKKLTTAHRGAQKPLTEQVLRGKRVCLLSEPLGGDLTVADRLVAPDVLVPGLDDPRVVRVLAELSPEDRAIALAHSHHGRTWAEAAQDCGFAPERGESVRKKLKYAGTKLMSERQALVGSVR